MVVLSPNFVYMESPVGIENINVQDDSTALMYGNPATRAPRWSARAAAAAGRSEGPRRLDCGGRPPSKTLNPDLIKVSIEISIPSYVAQ